MTREEWNLILTMLDAYRKGQPWNHEGPETRRIVEKFEQFVKDCPHEHISWHGSRSECQNCGENVVVEGANYGSLD
jgi:hypothetical protein